MNKVNQDTNDTIAAIATPHGRGGIGIIRISGSKAEIIAQAILKKKIAPKQAHFGLFYDENSDIIDHGLAILFIAPNSFTGEDVLELHGHGSPIVLDSLLKRVLQLGARIAKPGEFSERAFLNNKIDLTQAEAVADLIEATSAQSAKSAIKSLQGEFSKRIDELLELVTKLRMYVEAAVDFTEEEIDFLSDDKVKKSITEIKQKIANVRKSAKQGVLLREGMTVVIVGKPNAGKSSLLNCLSGRDTAIVTDIAGTTRDVLREYIHIDGMPLHIIDTAGLQESTNVIEQEGIRRTWLEIEKADEILIISDINLTKETNPEVLLSEFFSKLQLKKSITVIKNKIDLTKEKERIEKHDDYYVIYLSAKKHHGIDILKEHFKNIMGFHENVEGVFIARRRHLNALERTSDFINSAQQQIEEGQAIEIIAEDLRSAQEALAEITGKFTTEDLLDEIFSTFCIGK